VLLEPLLITFTIEATICSHRAHVDVEPLFNALDAPLR
jgi:hypothetical protein